MKSNESPLSRKRIKRRRRRVWCGGLLMVFICVTVVLFLVVPRHPSQEELRWEPVSVEWEKVGEQLSFTLGPVTAGQETYTLVDCYVKSITPHAEQGRRGDFQYLRLSYRGKIVPSAAAVVEENEKSFSVTVLMRPKLIGLTPAQFSLTSQEADDLVVFENDESVSKAWQGAALKAIERHIARLSFSTNTQLSDEDGTKDFFASQLPLPSPTGSSIDVPFYVSREK